MLLGALGIHKFILGYTGADLIMLLITVLSCGIAYPVITRGALSTWGRPQK